MSANSSFAHYSPSTKLLIHAVQKNQPNLAREAIREGANVNVLLPDGNRLLHICADEVMGSILINHGADVNAINASQQTPLHTSMRNGLIPLTLLLISNGSEVNAQELDGTTPLHLAQAIEVNDALLTAQADPNIQNIVGDTPLHLAIRIKGSPVVTALVNAGADKMIKNQAGNDAYDELNLLVQRRAAELAKVWTAIYGIPPQAEFIVLLEAAAVTPTLSMRTQTPAFNLLKQNTQSYNISPEQSAAPGAKMRLR